jgi:hypothetical protein
MKNSAQTNGAYFFDRSAVLFVFEVRGGRKRSNIST